MRKIFLFNMVTLDGFFEGPNHDISWHNVDEEFNQFAIEQLDNTDLLLFGRITYELMASYWPTEHAKNDDPAVAGKMNAAQKIVFSKTLKKADWNNTKLIKGNISEEVSALKQKPGKDIAIFGSADLASTFIQHGLIDEYRLMINPVLIGSGKQLFNGIKNRLNLKLIKTRTFVSGNVLLCFQPVV